MNQPRQSINRTEQAQDADRFFAARARKIQDRLLFELRAGLSRGKSRQVAELERMFARVDPRSER